MIEIITTPNADIVTKLTDLYIETFSAPPRNENIDRDEIVSLMEKEITEGQVRVVFDAEGKLIGSLSLVPIAL